MDTYLIALIITTLVGIANTVYLSYCCITKKDVKCLFMPAQMCFKVQYSKYSRTFGIPNPYLGLIMLVAILAFTILFIQSLVPFELIFAIISAGLLFSLYFTYIQAFVIKVFCTWCVLSVLVFISLFVISLIQIIKSSMMIEIYT